MMNWYEKYNEIWDKVNKCIKKKLIINLYETKKYLKTKITSYEA